MMSSGSLVLFFAIAGAVILTGVLLFFSGIRAMNDAVRTLEGRVGGTFLEGGLFDDPRLDFTLGGCPASLRVARRDRSSPPALRVVVDVKNRTSGRFVISPVTFPLAFDRRFGKPYVTVGDKAFDRDYVVESEPSFISDRVFAPARRGQAVATVRRLRPFESPSIELDQDHLIVQVRQDDADPELLLALVTTAEEMLGYLLESAPLPGVRIEEVRALSGGECPVCGSTMEEGVIRCEACRTPHHRECWQYMGRCSTYACQGKRSVA